MATDHHVISGGGEKSGWKNKYMQMHKDQINMLLSVKDDMRVGLAWVLFSSACAAVALVGRYACTHITKWGWLWKKVHFYQILKGKKTQTCWHRFKSCSDVAKKWTSDSAIFFFNDDCFFLHVNIVTSKVKTVTVKQIRAGMLCWLKGVICFCMNPVKCYYSVITIIIAVVVLGIEGWASMPKRDKQLKQSYLPSSFPGMMV